MNRPALNFCSGCGAPLARRIPDGDNRPRSVCESCGAIHYQNPRVVAGCVACWEQSVLLCRRAIEPRKGFWTLPAGYMENGETVAEAAMREALEEANARIAIDALFTCLNVPRIDQVHMMFRARLLDPEVWPGAESLEVAMVSEADVPWSEMAFPTVSRTLRLFFEDRRRGSFGTHVVDITRRPGEA